MLRAHPSEVATPLQLAVQSPRVKKLLAILFLLLQSIPPPRRHETQHCFIGTSRSARSPVDRTSRGEWALCTFQIVCSLSVRAKQPAGPQRKDRCLRRRLGNS